MIKPALIISATLVFPSCVFGQSMRDRAEGSVGTIGSVGVRITDQAMQNVVTPFETDAPPESALSDTDFDDEALLRRSGNGADGQAYSTMVDSALNRPDVDLGNDPLSLADDAIEHAEDTLGGLFTATGGECSSTFESGNYSGIQACTRILGRNIGYCDNTRVITVDRDDSWSCSAEEEQFNKSCEKDITWQCADAPGSSCIPHVVQFSPVDVLWNPAGNEVEKRITPETSGACSIKTDTYTIRSDNRIDFDSLIFANIAYNGVAQIKVNGQVVLTTGDQGTVHFSWIPEIVSSAGTLVVGQRDCGKNCSRTAIFAGDTWIEDCSSEPRATQASVNVVPFIEAVSLGPSTIVNNAIYLAQAQPNTELQIEILRGNISEEQTVVTHRVEGGCCANIVAEEGGQC